MEYDSAMWIFEEDNPKLIRLIRDYFGINEEMRELVDEKSYIVIRCVKKKDQVRSYESHFDNYEESFVVPLKVPLELPRGELMVWYNARRYPHGLLEHIFTKGIFQNKIFRMFMKKFLMSKFIEVDVRPGDVARFAGFTTLHFNNPVSSERRSILIHNHRAFDGSRLVALVEKISKLNVK
jgi:hypothetical protein